MTQNVLIWAVAGLLLFWQICLTYMVLRVREDEAAEVANIGRMAYGFSSMLDRLEGMISQQQSAPPATWQAAPAPPAAYPAAWAPPAPECSCPVHGTPPARNYEPQVANGWNGHSHGYPHLVPGGGRRRG